MNCRAGMHSFWPMILVAYGLAVLGYASPALAADEIKIELKDFKFQPPASVENPDQVFVFDEDGGRLCFYTNGPAEASFKVPADGDYEIVVNASGDPAENIRPAFKVSIDGKDIGEEVTLTADYEKDYKLTAPLTAGEHKLRVEFTNDTYKEGELDSNLYLHGVKLVKKEAAAPGTAK